MRALQLSIFLLLQVSIQASAQTVWAVFGFNVHGDTTPTLLGQPRTLTPLGAKDVYNVGGKFRDRYILGGSTNVSRGTWVNGLNQHRLDSEQVRIYTTSDQFNEASSLAFMQGFYPPLGTANQSYTYIDDTYLLSNGSIAGAPLDDYQYPRIYAAGLADPTSILVAGQADCDNYQELQVKYRITPEFQQIESDNAQFYSDLYNIALDGILSRSMASYAQATEIFQYLQYGYLHNRSLESTLSLSDLQRARVLANQYAFATNGNLTSSSNGGSERIRAIAGRTLSRLILQALETNIQTQGFSSKMTLVFGSMEPVIAFASLSQLASPMNSEFYGMPVDGASLVLELFSMNTTTSDIGYPQISDLYVRLLFRNSSSTNEAFTQYPLFGYSPSQVDLPFTEFAARLSTFLLPSTESWCDACSSSPMFCFGAANAGKRSAKSRLSLAGAGAIGAGVTLAVLAAVVGIAWLCGIGLHRRRKPASFGGFKGNKKMASDQDVSFSTSKNGIFHKIADPGRASTNVKSHERTGSWEMRNKNRTSADNALRLDDDRDIADISANSEPVKCHQIRRRDVPSLPRHGFLGPEYGKSPCGLAIGQEHRSFLPMSSTGSLPPKEQLLSLLVLAPRANFIHRLPLFAFHVAASPSRYHRSLPLQTFLLGAFEYSSDMKTTYSITELLALRGNAAVDIGQFTIYALENNLLWRGKSVPNTTSSEPRRNERSTTTSEDHKSTSQPNSGSQENITENDSGFVKFLKQHTSPKHQRVTPGGKVVDVNSSVSIPEFKPPSTKTSDECPQKNGKETGKVISLQGAGTGKKTVQISGASSNSNGFKLDPPYPGPYEKITTGPVGVTTATVSEEVGPQIANLYPSLQSLQQLQLSLMAPDVYRQQPLPWAPSFYPIVQVTQAGQETIATPYHNYPQLFLPDAAAWHQTAPQSYANQNPILHNLSQQQTAPLLATVWPTVGKQGAAVPTADSQVPIPASHSFTSLSTVTGQLTPYSGSLPTYITDQSTQRSLQDLTKEYQSLSSQLVDLDRYMAIHTFEMDAETKKSLVEQRRGLVKDLDMARRYKEHLESNIKRPSASLEPVSAAGFQQESASNLGFVSHPTLSRLVAVEQSAELPTSSLPIALSSINAVPLQFSQAGYVPVIPNLGNWSEYAYNAHLPQDPQFTSQTHLFSNQSNELNASQLKNILSQQNHADTSTCSPFININQLHRQIEEAARRGESVDGLFEELARITEQSVAQRNAQRLGSFTGAQPNGVASDKTSGNLHQSFPTAQKEAQRGEGSNTETSSSSWMIIDGQVSTNSGGHISPRKDPSQSKPSSRLEKDPAAMSKQAFKSLRHSRDERGIGIQAGDRKALRKPQSSRSVMLTPWAGREQDVTASKACAPVISRVNAHGFLPSFDGANDAYDTRSQRSMILIDLESDDNGPTRSGENQPWYLREPRPKPIQSEVRRFFLDIEEEEYQMIHKYRMQTLGDAEMLRK
ncbi:hypothetical protein UA08_08553 [Talaromyces atroroseus]|uniref:Histidine acid phosphatase n=1 Tax=Talaromyces atroroseus TaxID=1441469 RepID=A0A1Q5Q850_TALAT|nr:hypothetical protein UA08_08553 [Talaromyces atroroseus]OKL56301.1 hypothetical protein UA08_08553 [Talaromyces atroroseus]